MTTALCVAIAVGRVSDVAAQRPLSSEPSNASKPSSVAHAIDTTILAGETIKGPTRDRSQHSSARAPQPKNILERKFSINVQNVTISDAIREIARQANILLVYSADILPANHSTSLRASNITVGAALKSVLAGTGVIVRVSSSGEVGLVRETPREAVQQTTATVIGRVIDSASGEGVQGATVRIPQTKFVVITDAAGAYRLTGIPAGSQTISVHLLGFNPKRVTVVLDSGKVTTVNFVLSASSRVLSEVVTTATGQQRRAEIANDIAKIDAEKVMEKNPVRSLTDLIAAAQVPGVQVTPTSGAPGAPARIRIRGIGSISQSNDPVVIVDGVWVSGPSSKSNDDVYRVGGTSNTNRFVPSRLDDIDPAIIETIEIVRGPSAATLYGQDAANGVIIITTKRGTPGTNRWNISYNRDWSTLPGTPPPEYIGFGTRSYSSEIVQCNIFNMAAGACTQDSVISLQQNDPFLSAEGSGSTDRYTLSLDGGTSQLLYALNAVFQNQIGARRIPGAELMRFRLLGLPIESEYRHPSTLRRTSLSARVSTKPISTLDVSLNMTATQSNQRENEFTNSFSLADPRDTVTIFSKTGTMSPVRSGSVATTGLFGLQADWRPRQWWRSALQAGVERTARRDATLTLPYRCVNGNCVTSNGGRGSNHLDQTVYTGRFQLSALPMLGWANRFLSIRPAFGADFRKNEQTNVRITGNQLAPGSEDIGTGTIDGSLRNSATATAGWYLNANIGLFERLYFDTGIRQDIGSAITSDAVYPKLGTSWLVSDESFFPKNPYLSALRLRFMFGHAAVQPDVTDIHGQYQTGTAYVNNQIVSTISFTRVGNSTIEPERATEFETGFDADFFGDRVQTKFTWAHKKNVNNLIERSLAPSTGVSFKRKENIAKVVNRVVEMSITGRVIDLPGTLLSVTTNMTFQDNQVTRLGKGVSPFGTDEAKIVEGYPVSGLWLRPVLGFDDVNGNGILENDELVVGDSTTYVGWMQPKFYAGYSASLSMLNRQLTFAAQFQFNGTYVQNLTHYDGRGFWDATAPLNEQALARVAQNIGVRQAISDLRFSSASVSLYLPQQFLKRINARSAQVSLQGSNLALWTRYRGRDPGVNSTPVGEQLTDNGAIQPPPRQYTLAFRLGF